MLSGNAYLQRSPDNRSEHDTVLAGSYGRGMFRSTDGATWEAAGHGIEEPMADMVELFVAAPDGSIWAICPEGRLLRAEPGERRWHGVLAQPTQTLSTSYR